MLIQIRQIDDALVAQVKKLTGKGSGSQALIAAAELVITQEARIASMQDENARLRERLARMNRLVKELAPLCVQVAEVAGQQDLFD
ncbi:hypothetical protein M1D58_27310 (plasmid) [Pseudomonas sp. R4-76]|uniref:hypothetical protein n=1 Tax=unclassified Pseudomonas TaxID=196821 RepID=UPI003DA8FAFF